MAKVFKIVGKFFTIHPNGQGYTLNDEYSYISEPFTDGEEMSKQLVLKQSEYVRSKPVHLRELLLVQRFRGYNRNNEIIFTPPLPSAGGYLIPGGEDPQQWRELVKLIQQKEFDWN